ncbi:pilus assembly protein Flp/PilA [Hyphomicrobiales bacterium]|nr:pilus assembly protein Flp/PilA [Hyphomicrobiales bacterium]
MSVLSLTEPLQSEGSRQTVVKRSPSMTNVFARFVKDESGATAIEYGLIAALIAVVCIATWRTIGTDLNIQFGKVSDGLK